MRRKRTDAATLLALALSPENFRAAGTAKSSRLLFWNQSADRLRWSAAQISGGK